MKITFIKVLGVANCITVGIIYFIGWLTITANMSQWINVPFGVVMSIVVGTALYEWFSK